MRLRDLVSCRAVMRTVLVLVLSFAAVPAHPADHVVNGVTIVDANGTVLGPVYGDPFFPQVILTFSGRIFFVTVRPSGFLGSSLGFTSLNCQGPPFIYEPSLIPGAALWLPGTTVYLADPTAPTQSLTILSSFNWEFQQCGNITPNIQPVKPAVPIIDLNTVFTPPFSIQVDPDRVAPATPGRIPPFFKWPPF